MKVTVVTKAYNAKPYVDQCIKSVLNQTHKDLEYILIDNASDDGSEEIIREYAQQDSRIIYIRYEENVLGAIWYKPVLEFSTGDYFTLLDADDWLEPDFLEQMVILAQENNSDIVTTGSVMHNVDENRSANRQVEKRLVLNKNEFAQYFPYYHVYFRTAWAKLVRMKIIKSIVMPTVEKTGVSYGIDTLTAFAWLRQCKKICIDDSILHHYRIHKKSISHQYDPRQSKSDLYLFNDALDFLSSYGPIGKDNLFFLHRVYANSVTDTVKNIASSTLTNAQKSEEYYKILERQVTEDCYKESHEDVTNSKTRMFYEAFKVLSYIGRISSEWHELFSCYFPKCQCAITIQTIKLLLTDKELFNNFVNDDSNSAAECLCDFLSHNKYIKQFNLPEILCSLSRNHPILSSVTDSKFIKKYSGIYLLLYQNKYDDALGLMTDTLLKGKTDNETLLQTYLTVSALLDRVDEFIFGKIKAAEFFLSSGRCEECREALADLEEMGVEDNDEIKELKVKLNNS